jgi:uncharacterized damage-inducible protein DinB
LTIHAPGSILVLRHGLPAGQEFRTGSFSLQLSLHTQFKTFAHYNAWANAKLYEACGKLSEAEYLKSRPSFFGSIHATLNHILVGDRAWMSRFTGGVSNITALNQELYAEFTGLHVARQAEDALIISYVENLDDGTLMSWLEYTNMAGEDQADEISILLSHFFNHQTHHRGQVHALLSQTDVAPPSIDLIYYLREQQ